MLTGNQLGIIYGLIAAASMGTIAIFAKMAYSLGANPLTMLTLRFGLASIILWLYLYWQKQIKPVNSRRLFAFVILGLIYGLASYLYFASIQLTSASLATLLLYTSPVFVLVISVLIGDEKLTSNKVISVITASVGLYLVLNLTGATRNPLGILFGIGSGFFYGLFILGSNRFTAGINPILATAYAIPSTFAFQLVVSIASGQITLALPPVIWFLGVLLALFGTAIGIVFIYKCIQLIGASKNAIITTIEPVITAILAALIFHERMTVTQYFGGLLIVIAILIIQISKPQNVIRDTGKHHVN